MTSYALCVGINRYGSGMDLAGCRNDAEDWADALNARDFRTTTMLDGDATKTNILDGVRRMLSSAKRGDTAILTFSGHGTWVADRSNDESDRRDEALCPVDVTRGALIVDDELRNVLLERNDGTRVAVISDSCHSGTVTRFADPLIPKDHLRKARFLPPELISGEDPRPTASSFARLSAPRYPALLMSGCADPEYSYDAWFGNRPNGAFTRVALDSLRSLTIDGRAESPTWREWHAEIRRRLPSVDYPQTPMLYGTSTQKKWRALT